MAMKTLYELASNFVKRNAVLLTIIGFVLNDFPTWLNTMWQLFYSQPLVPSVSSHLHFAIPAVSSELIIREIGCVVLAVVVANTYLDKRRIRLAKKAIEDNTPAASTPAIAYSAPQSPTLITGTVPPVVYAETPWFMSPIKECQACGELFEITFTTPEPVACSVTCPYCYTKQLYNPKKQLG